MPSIRPYSFSGIPRLTQQQADLYYTLATFLSARSLTPALTEELAADLETFLKDPLQFSAPESKVLTGRDFLELLPTTTCLTVLGVGPSEKKIVVDLDSKLATFCIDRLLGGTGEVSILKRALTDVEEGVLSFLLLRVISRLHDGWATGREWALVLDRFASQAEELETLVEADAYYHFLGFRLSIGKRVGYLRILLPRDLLAHHEVPPSQQKPATRLETAQVRRALASVADLEVEARVEVARLNLRPDEVANLDPGDIIVLENHRVTKSPLGLEGEVFVAIGSGDHGGLRGRLINEGDLCKLEITELAIQQTPAEIPMADKQPDEPPPPAEGEPSDNLEQTEGLLNEVDASVVVELARLKMNARQVVKSTVGQVIRLPRNPQDPVDLVVGGKLFARGELVEIDGELGVRLTQVAGF